MTPRQTRVLKSLTKFVAIVLFSTIFTSLLTSCSGFNGGGRSVPPALTSFGDFPSEPIAGGAIPTNAVHAIADAFNAAVQKNVGGPCIAEPTMNAVYPRNFTPPLFEWVPANNQNVFELRLHVSNQTNDLVTYTTLTSFTMSSDTWRSLASDSQDLDVSVTIRGGQYDPKSLQLFGPVSAGNSGSVHIAPVDATGAIVYWTTSPSTALKGFHIGDAQVVTVLTPEAITSAGKTTGCIGCHTASPDGAFVFFGRVSPFSSAYSVDVRSADNLATSPNSMTVTANALANLARPSQNLPILSKTHYTPADAVVITGMNSAFTGNKWELVWTDLLATGSGTGVLQRQSDPNGVATAAWSHDGTRVVYTSSSAIVDAHPDVGNADLWQVPYNGRMGGVATPLSALNDPQSSQYYPALSPDDLLVAFNRNPRGTQMYNSAGAEVWVGSVAGASTPASRLSGNDLNACTSTRSPGITNSWPRWAPSVQVLNNKKYYWLVFSSSRRAVGEPAQHPPQLFISAVNVDTSGQMTSYPALYIPTQPALESNHTPAWDDFIIPAG